MDFTPEATAAALAEAADEAMRRLTPDWTDRFDDGFDRAAWRLLIDCELATMAFPPALGGEGLDVDALGALAARAGRGAVVTPLVGTLVAGALFAGDESAATHWADRAAVRPGRWFAVAVGERGRAPGDPPQVRISGSGPDAKVSGVKTGVCFAEGAAGLIVAGPGTSAVVDPQAPGVRLLRTPSSTGAAEFTVTFDDAPALTVAGPAGDLYRALQACYADGLLAGALDLTATHVTDRQQFGRAIGAFQAVAQQLADVYVVSRTLNLVATSAAWRLATGRDADEDLATADYWTAAELPAALRTMTHLHGGIGVDLSYPLHRYFSLAKDLARFAGGPSASLDALAGVTVPQTQRMVRACS